MKDFISKAVTGLFVIVVIVLLFWWPVYKYQDCRNVGHSRLYCVMDIGH